MDRGAARSRRKQSETSRKVHTGEISARHRPRPDRDDVKLSSSRAGPSDPAKRPPETDRPASRFKPKVVDNTDPARFRPKAIRDSAALIWSQAPFTLPPSKESLTNVTRVDLAGSGCTDVSWLEGTSVTWLSLKGCAIGEGWDAVGSLRDLAVLNISETGLQRLPPALRGLQKLKALVAMGNPWTELDSHILQQWTQLNSMIASHSPNLETLPVALTDLRQLAKLSFSHCPRLRSQGLPDLSHLPLLRDVKLNNLALLDSLPSHIASWGKGELPVSERTSTVRHGDGLEVLDLGNCSLAYSTVETVFLGTDWPHLRSLSLHSNPLALSHPDYAAALQSSGRLPNLQIIDAKRVVERKRKGEVQETRLEKRRREKKEKRRMTGANAKIVGDKARVWGDKTVGTSEMAEVLSSSQPAPADATAYAGSRDAQTSATEHRKRKRQGRKSELPTPTITDDVDKSAVPAAVPDESSSRKKRKRTKGAYDMPDDERSVGHPATRPERAETHHEVRNRPTGPAEGQKAKPIRKAEGGKVEVVAKSAGGINLKEAFTKPQERDADGGLGLGGW